MRNLFLNVAALFTMFVAGPLIAQDGELKSILVDNDPRPLVDADHPDAPEPSVKTVEEPAPDLEALEDFPPEDKKLNPIPGLAPIVAPQPRVDSEVAKPPVGSRTRVTPQPVASSVPVPQRPTTTMSSIGFSLVPDADVPRVRGVIVDGLAQRAGMKPGDFISAIGNTPTKTPADVQRALAALDTDEFDVALIRGGQRRSIRVRVPRDNPRSNGQPIPVLRASATPAQQLTNSPESIAPAAAPTATQPDSEVLATPQVQQSQSTPRPAVRRPTQPAQPLIGDGGRLIGNGRVINSVRRLFRW